MPKVVAPLRDTNILNAKPKAKDYSLFDGEGLFLLVKANGTKSWRFKYKKPCGKQGLTAFGDYPGLSLAGARQKRQEAKEMLHLGIDPIEKKRAVVIANANLHLHSFENVARSWHKAAAAKWSKDHAARVLVRLEQNLFGALGVRVITEITSRELIQVLVGVNARSAEVASRVQQYIFNIFRYAIQNGIIAGANPANDIKGFIDLPKASHRPALPLDRISELQGRIEQYGGRAVTRYALKLSLHVFLRSSELRFARWPEFDLVNGMWKVPAEREEIEGVKYSGRGGKMGEHLVPLSRQVIALLRELQELTGAFEFVFPGDHAHWKAISENTINKALRLMGYDTKKDICGHGLRTMACSALNESGLFSEDAVERQMSHQERDGVRAAYIHKAEFLEERRKMMQWWSDFLEANQGGVIPPYEFVRRQ